MPLYSCHPWDQDERDSLKENGIPTISGVATKSFNRVRMNPD